MREPSRQDFRGIARLLNEGSRPARQGGLPQETNGELRGNPATPLSASAKGPGHSPLTHVFNGMAAERRPWGRYEWGGRMSGYCRDVQAPRGMHELGTTASGPPRHGNAVGVAGRRHGAYRKLAWNEAPQVTRRDGKVTHCTAELTNKAAEYRGFASKCRRQAEDATLPQERDVIRKAALRWDMLAEEIEREIAQLALFRAQRPHRR